MGKLHGNAALTEKQRKLIRDLYLEGQSISSLAVRFGVNRKTADRWAKRDNQLDNKSGPKTPRTVITDEYRQAIISHRKKHEDHGAITIAYHLKADFPFANRGTVQKILTEEKLSRLKNTTSKDKKS
jgi:transposase